MKEFCGLRAKTYAHLLNDDSENEKFKGTNKSVINESFFSEIMLIACLKIKPY